MTIGLVGRKCGMTRIFNEDGVSIPVSVVEIEPNKITQIKTLETDGYEAIQITTGSRKAKRVTKPLAGHFAKANVEAGRGLWEFQPNEDEKKKISDADIQVGIVLPLTMFAEGQSVDVKGVTKGKGFAGVIKRHHFATQDATHGNSLSHRAPGSIGQNQTPGRVFKGKKMAGQMGNVNRTIPNLKIVKIDDERNLILIKGAIPGAPGGNIIIVPSVKGSVSKEKK